MKKISITLFFILILSGTCFPQCGWQPVRADTSVGWGWNFFTNSNTGYSVGARVLTPTSYFPIVFKTTNAGVNWFEQYTPLSDTVGYFRCVFFTDVNTGFVTDAKSGDNTFGRILKTTNAGINWYNVPLPVSKHMTMIHFINSSTGFATGYETILKTTNTGETWVPVLTSGYGYLFAIHFADVNTGIVVGNLGYMYKTTDGGNNWSFLPTITSLPLWGIWFINSSTGIAVGGQSNNLSNIILRTTNAGYTWDTIPNPYSTGILWSVRFISPETGYIIGWCGQVLKTTNGGINWMKQTLPVTDSSSCELRSCFFTSANTGYIAGDIYNLGEVGYIFKTTNGGVTFTNQISNEIPAEFLLYQNYPNPFNPVTTIKFSIPFGEVYGFSRGVGFVTLKVYDILGKEVATLVNEKLQPGTYEVTFDGSNLTSGVYFYKLSAGDFIETKRMILLK